MASKKDGTVNEKWNDIFKESKDDILAEIRKKGYYNITAKFIKEFKEPRLMCKFDSSERLPSVFEKNKINILPINRKEYVLGNFNMFEEHPEFDERDEIESVTGLSDFESLDLDNLTSEANAINVLRLSGILDSFLNTDKNHATFNGRMSLGEFEYCINNTIKDDFLKLKVNGSQCEIDAGFENENSVVIVEAKNVINKDFNIRQLYFPYRLWLTRVDKPIRLVFFIYSNKIFRLYEYTFEDVNDMSSIKLLKKKYYAIDEMKITMEDIIRVFEKTHVKYDDDQEKKELNVPFIQADSMERVISLLENLYENDLTSQDIAADVMNFEERQSDYYFNAGKYLGLFKKNRDIDGKVLIQLTELGNKVINMNYKTRQLKIVELMFEHEIFHQLFQEMMETKKLPDKSKVKELMKKLNVCSDKLLDRRSSSVIGWLKWIYELTRIKSDKFKSVKADKM